MFKTVTQSDFTASFHRMGRGNQFSHEGLLALYEFLNEFEDSTGEQIELDVIGICCDFTEYESIDEALLEYGLENLDELQDQTFTLQLNNGGLIIQNY